MKQKVKGVCVFGESLCLYIYRDNPNQHLSKYYEKIHCVNVSYDLACYVSEFISLYFLITLKGIDLLIFCTIAQ